MATKKTKTSGDGSVMPQLVELLKVVIQRQERTNEALGETNAALLGLAKRQDETNAALLGELKGVNERLDTLHEDVLALGAKDVSIGNEAKGYRLEAMADHEDLKARVVKLEEAVFKTAAE